MSTFGKPWSVDDLEKHLRKHPEARIPAHTPAKPEKTPYSQSWNDSRPSVEQALTTQGAAGVALLEAVTGRKSPKANEKVRNAQKIVDEKGRKFDSRLEFYFAQELEKHRIPYEFQKSFTLQEPFRYNGKAVREIRIIMDFFLPQFNMIADTKGHQLADGKLKHKMLKRKLLTDGTPYEIRIPRNRKECDSLILELLGRKK